MTVQDLKSHLDKSGHPGGFTDEDLTVLDVRDAREWAEGHISGARHLYVGQVTSKLSEIPADKPLAVICSVGHRAGIACSVLLQAGFSRVSNVLGGLTAWQQAGYPTVNETKTTIQSPTITGLH
jgi:hydroxyacylglutathione hydrolase